MEDIVLQYSQEFDHIKSSLEAHNKEFETCMKEFEEEYLSTVANVLQKLKDHFENLRAANQVRCHQTEQSLHELEELHRRITEFRGLVKMFHSASTSITTLHNREDEFAEKVYSAINNSQSLCVQPSANNTSNLAHQL